MSATYTIKLAQRVRHLAFAIPLVILTACGGGGGSTPTVATYTISGAVSGAVTSGVTINLTGALAATATTNATGNYSFTNLANGSYTVTPSLAGNSFSPSGTAVSVNGADVPNTNFTATATTLSGTAAVGAPIVGATVNVTCAAGALLSNIPVTSATGAWSVTLLGQTLPCAVQVSGGTVNGVANTTAYQSIATSLNTVNVTPLTSLLIANLAGTATPNTWFANLTPAQLSAITPAQVSTSLTNLRTALNLTALNTVDPITLPFNPTPGVVMDDILSALGTAMASNPVLSYTNLLASAGASAGAAITPPVVLNAALVTAFASTPSGGASGGVTGTAAQYFSKRAVGNIWTWNGVSQPGSFATNEIITIIASTGNALTITDSTTDGMGGANNSTRTLELDTAGAWVDSFGTMILPATFSVGQTWVSTPAMSSTGISATISTIVAFNVTRTVPAGTFTDCLQVNSTQTVTTGSIFTTTYTTRYYSPTAGVFVDSHSEISNGESATAQLQAGYIANSFTPTSITATANTTAQNLTVGTAISSFSPLTASGGTLPYTYSYAGTLPAGLSFNASTGAVTGTPTAAYATANLVFSVKDANNVTASTTSTVSFTATAAATNTAAYYFSKRAVGNTWTWNGVSQPGGITSSEVMIITADTGNAVTVSDTYTSGSTTYPPDTFTLQFGPLGELSATFGTYTALILPATFSVGTTWNSKPANLAPGDSAETSTVVAFNVTRSVPAGTFTDCLQVNSTQSHANGSVTTNTTTYYSPTAGLFVETLYAFSGGGTETVQLQAGYIANP